MKSSFTWLHRKYQKGLIQSSERYIGRSENVSSNWESYLDINLQFDRQTQTGACGRGAQNASPCPPGVMTCWNNVQDPAYRPVHIQLQFAAAKGQKCIRQSQVSKHRLQGEVTKNMFHFSSNQLWQHYEILSTREA